MKIVNICYLPNTRKKDAKRKHSNIKTHRYDRICIVLVGLGAGARMLKSQIRCVLIFLHLSYRDIDGLLSRFFPQNAILFPVWDHGIGKRDPAGRTSARSPLKYRWPARASA
jgi:hypothetical protein